MVSMTQPWSERSVYIITGRNLHGYDSLFTQTKNVKIVSNWQFCETQSMRAIQKFYMGVLSEITTWLITKEGPSLRTTFFNRYIQSK